MSQYLNLQERLYPGVGPYDIPEIEPVKDLNVDSWIGFNYAKTYPIKKRNKAGVNFFLDDYQFERCWNKPKVYIDYLKDFGALCSPDFSMFMNFPKAVCIFNHYRKHWLARYWQEYGITVIPTVGWMGPDSYDWCFDGEPKHGIVAVSNCGCMVREESKQLFRQGYEEMLKRLEPTEVLFFAHTFDDYPGPVRYIRFSLGSEEYYGNNINYGPQKIILDSSN